jgi:hypothetical protein
MMSVGCQLHEHVRHLANDLDIEEWGEVFDPPIPGVPDGWIPSGTPITFLGYPFLPTLTILADGSSLFFSPSMHQKRGETGRRNR